MKKIGIWLFVMIFGFFEFILLHNPYSANYPLAIINIRPAGTGDPAIGENNRIFRAYPGIEYNIRVGVIGGEYPYVFKLNMHRKE